MSYGTFKWVDWVLDEEESIKHVKAAYDMGINAFDTANVYSNGLSEEVLGKAIKQHNLPRDEIVVMTKFWFVLNHDPRRGIVMMSDEEKCKNRYTNQFGSSRKHIFDSVKHSLKRLQLDYIDLLQCHRFDPETPIEETMQALNDVVKAGYVRYIGMSSCYGWQFQKMQNYAIANGLTPFISMQNFYNAAYREEEREMMPLLQDLGVGCIPWSPLAGGFLARPFSEETLRGTTDPFRVSKEMVEKEPFLISINRKVEEIAKARNISMAQVALAYCLSKPFLTAPIVGTTSLDKLKDLCDGIHVKLTDEEIKSIDALYRPRAILGHA